MTKIGGYRPNHPYIRPVAHSQGSSCHLTEDRLGATRTRPLCGGHLIPKGYQARLPNLLPLCERCKDVLAYRAYHGYYRWDD